MHMLDNLISADGFITVNKKLARQIGILEAYFLSELVSQRKRFGEDDFYFTQNNFEKETGLTEYQQRQIIKKLQKLGLISVKKRWLPARHFFRIHDIKIMMLFDENLKNVEVTIEEPVENAEKKKKEIKKIYGEYKNVKLSDQELEKLNNEYWEAKIQEYIQIMDEWIECKGYKYKNHYLALKNWIKRDKGTPQNTNNLQNEHQKELEKRDKEIQAKRDKKQKRLDELMEQWHSRSDAIQIVVKEEEEEIEIEKKAKAGMQRIENMRKTYFWY